MRVSPSSCQQCQLLYVGLDENVGQLEIIIQKDIHQTPLCSQSKNFGHSWTGDVRIDQQYCAIHLHRNAHRQINGAKTFPFSGKRTGNHDQISVLDHARSLVECVRQQGTLDYAELLGYLGSSLVRRDNAIITHFRQIERDSP